MLRLRAYLFDSSRWPWVPRVAALVLLAGSAGLSVAAARWLGFLANSFVRYAAAFIVVQVAEIGRASCRERV